MHLFSNPERSLRSLWIGLAVLASMNLPHCPQEPEKQKETPMPVHPPATSAPLGKPPLDLKVPSSVSIATFALG